MNNITNPYNRIQSIPNIEHYIPISSNLLHNNAEHKFPMYIIDWETQNIVQYCEAEVPYKLEHIQLLTQGGEAPVLIPASYSNSLNKRLTSNLTQMIEDPAIPLDTKTEQFHALSNSIMKSLFDNPPDIDTFIETSAVVSNHMADLIQTGPRVIGKLNELRGFDYYTFSHSLNVTALTVGFYYDMESNSADDRMKELTRGVLLHDIGKCDIPKPVLNKQGPLTEEEWVIMKSHTERGYQKLEADPNLSHDSRQVSLYHHEAWDGNGYPHGLAGEDIPFTSRICKICDVYDALTSKRTYKSNMTPYASLQLMKDKMHHQLDRTLFDHFMQFLKKVFSLQ